MNPDPISTDQMQSSTSSIWNILIRLACFLGLVIACLVGYSAWSSRPGKVLSRFIYLSNKPWVFNTYSRVGTGLQRADDIAFFDSGKRLAMTCPRYTKFTLWDTTGAAGPQQIREIELQGRPQRITPYKDKVFIVQRPPGDDRHIKPGFFEVFDNSGKRVAGPIDIGWDPDEIALVERDGKLYGLILLSGNAEGEDNRPAPCLNIVEIHPETFQIQEVGKVVFNEPEFKGEDPLRVLNSKVVRDGKSNEYSAWVSFGRKAGLRKVDWTDPRRPGDQDWWATLKGNPLGMAIDENAKVVWATNTDTNEISTWPLDPDQALAGPRKTKEKWSALESFQLDGLVFNMVAISEDSSEYGFLNQEKFELSWKLKGPFGFGSVRPMDLSVYSPDPDTLWIAICDRTGGLHWIVGHR